MYQRQSSLLHWAPLSEWKTMLICARLYFRLLCITSWPNEPCSPELPHHCDTTRHIVLWLWALSLRINWLYLQNILGLVSVKKPLSDEHLSGSHQIATARIGLVNEGICGSHLWGITVREELKLDWGEEPWIITAALYSLCILYPDLFQLSAVWTAVPL